MLLTKPHRKPLFRRLFSLGEIAPILKMIYREKTVLVFTSKWASSAWMNWINAL